jgi:hypothetical protein
MLQVNCWIFVVFYTSIKHALTSTKSTFWRVVGSYWILCPPLHRYQARDETSNQPQLNVFISKHQNKVKIPHQLSGPMTFQHGPFIFSLTPECCNTLLRLHQQQIYDAQTP